MITFEKFCEVVALNSHVPKEHIHEGSSFRDDLGIDSLQMVNLFVQCTEEFGVGTGVIRHSDDMKTVGNLYKAMTREEN